MSRPIPRFLAGMVACTALRAPALAMAGQVLSVKGDRVDSQVVGQIQSLPG